MRAMVVGVWSALRTPWAIAGLGMLTSEYALGGVSADDRRALCALRSAQRTLALLARVPGGWWRTTCLYRSVAECLALRAMGVRARVAIALAQELGWEHKQEPGWGHEQELGWGHKQELVPGPGVVAHAWVEDANGMTLGSAAANPAMTLLRPALSALSA